MPALFFFEQRNDLFEVFHFFLQGIVLLLEKIQFFRLAMVGIQGLAVMPDVFAAQLLLRGIQGKEVTIEDPGDLVEQVGIDAFAFKNIVYNIAAAVDLFGKYAHRNALRV